MGEGGGGAGDAEGGGGDRGDEHGGAELVDAAHRPGGGPAGAAVGLGVGDAVPEDDVEHEPGAVGEGEGKTQRLGDQANVGEGEDPAHRHDQGEQVAPRAGTGDGENHRAEELDRPDGGQRQAVHG